MLLHLDGHKLVLLCIGDRLFALLLPEPPIPIRKFCRECALAVSGKGCMRRPRLKRGRRQRRCCRRASGARDRPCDDGGDGDGPSSHDQAGVS